ncbi:MAG: helicase-exonuclease AddAB subunit AddA, partial [Firmicutes bacterium]|nr:helicase-exonuclease AddAB subunit AddA [Bacillota bacterium]
DEIIKEYFLQSIEYYFEQTKDVAKYTGIIYSVIKRFDDMYMQRKKEKSLFSFSDISHFCLNILIQDGKPSEAADVIRNKYTQIVIDEYQDINKIQDIIIEAVSGKDIGENNRFMVGDIKQSIYRFRLAEPKIFLEKYHSYSEDKESPERRIDFTKNFRSRENVIDSVNYLFKMLMSDTLGGVDYSDKKSQLYAGADYPDYSQYPDISELSEREKKMIEASEFYIIDKDSEEDNLSEDDEDTARIEDMKNSEVEASLAAKRIRELIESEFKIYDKENKKWRTVTYGDIVILLLYPKDKAVIYSKILEENGIPAYTKSDAGFFDLTEIMTVTDILKIIDNPLQDIEMISVMYSPIFSFSADELLEIKLYDRKKYIYNNMKSIAEEYIDESEIKTKIKNFLAMYDRWKEISVKLTISELLERIYNESNYYNYIGILFDGKIKQANLDKLIKKSEEFENGKINCLTDFIKYAQQLRENKGTSDGEAVLSSENNDVVRITSIHKSKGLEFPVVIIGGLAARFNMNDLKAEVLTDDEIGVGLSYFKPVMAYGEAIPKYKEKTLMHNVIRMILKRETYSEELRVLYVALTRAEEKLILIGTSSKQIDKKIADISSNYLEDGVISAYDRLNRSSSFFDWIAMALSRHISGECLRGGVFERGKMYDESKWHIEILKREECVSFNKEDIAENKSENMNIQKKFECFIQKAENMQTGEREKIFSNLSWVYPYSDDALLPSKESISQIKRMNLEMLNDETAADNISLKRPRFSDAKESSQAAVGYGTAYHEVLEFIDFSVINSIEDVKREKERILAEEKIVKETADKVDERKIYRFISSEIGQRIRNTKKVYKETPFVISLSPYEVYSDEKYKDSKKGILVNGIIDLYFEEKGKIILVDYKTDSVKKSSREDILKRYEVQLKIYKKALEKSTGKEVSEYGLYLISADEFLRY